MNFNSIFIDYFFFFGSAAEDVSIFLFYGSGDNSLLLESTFENDNFYDDYEFIWSCLPLEESCPYCPSEGFFFLFFSLLISSYIFLLSFPDNTEGTIYYSSGTIPNYLIDFGEEFENGISLPFPSLSSSPYSFLSALLRL